MLKLQVILSTVSYMSVFFARVTRNLSRQVYHKTYLPENGMGGGGGESYCEAQLLYEANQRARESRDMVLGKGQFSFIFSFKMYHPCLSNFQMTSLFLSTES